MKYFLLLLICVLFTACGNFSGLNDSCQENCSSNDNNNNSSQNQKIEDLNATVAGGVHSGTQVIRFNKENGELSLSLPITGSGLFEEFQQDLPQLPGAKLNFYHPDSGVALLEIRLPLTTLKSELSLDETTELPNGSPIPGFKNQAHGYVDLEVEGSFVRVYVSKGHLGLYMTSAFDPYVQVNYPLLNSDNQVLGYLSQIPSQAHFEGAFFIGFSLSENSF